MRLVKIVSSILLLSLLTLTGCNTLVTRRDLYSPKKGSGYWTDRAHYGKAYADATLTRTKPPAVKASTPDAR
jgi:hypothetical protein